MNSVCALSPQTIRERTSTLKFNGFAWCVRWCAACVSLTHDLSHFRIGLYVTGSIFDFSPSWRRISLGVTSGGPSTLNRRIRCSQMWFQLTRFSFAAERESSMFNPPFENNQLKEKTLSTLALIQRQIPSSFLLRQINWCEKIMTMFKTAYECFFSFTPAEKGKSSVRLLPLFYLFWWLEWHSILLLFNRFNGG